MRIFCSKGILKTRNCARARNSILGSRGIDARIGWGTERHLAKRKNGEYYRFADKKRKEVDFSKIVEDYLKKKSLVRILDIGAGNGNFLSELKVIFGKRIETHALVAKASEKLKAEKARGNIGRISEMSAESFLPKYHYDLIVSYFGGLYYSPVPHIALQKAAYSLAKGGGLFIRPAEPLVYHPEDPAFLRFNEVIEKLKSGGQFSVDTSLKDALVITRL